MSTAEMVNLVSPNGVTKVPTADPQVVVLDAESSQDDVEVGFVEDATDGSLSPANLNTKDSKVAKNDTDSNLEATAVGRRVSVDAAVLPNHEDRFLVGKKNFMIVGTQYYSGIINPGESCKLLGEPQNPYSINAIRVENLQGHKVGYIERAQAALLAPLMNHQSDLRLTPTVLGNGDALSIPVTIEFYAVCSNRESLQSVAHRLADVLRATFGDDSVDLSPGTDSPKPPMAVIHNQRELNSVGASASQILGVVNLSQIAIPSTVENIEKTIQNTVQEKKGLEDKATQDGTTLTQIPIPATSTSTFKVLKEGNNNLSEIPIQAMSTSTFKENVLNWEQEQTELDAIFEQIQREQLKNLPEIPMPSQFKDNVTLLDHQVSGIRWLVHKETDQTPHFFRQVQENGRSVWIDEITMEKHITKPMVTRGSILADDMGLGKTIMTLGLILCVPPEGHQYPERCAEKKADSPLFNRTKNAVTYCTRSWIPTKSELRQMKVGDLQEILARSGRRPNCLTGGYSKKSELIDLIIQGTKDGHITGSHFSKGPPSLESPPIRGANEAFCTLIVTPVSVFSNWIQQIKKHVGEGVLRVDVYHGTGRQHLLSSVQNRLIDILLVSYCTLAHEYGRTVLRTIHNDPVGKKPRLSSLFDLYFHRVVLDEAHTIRNSTTNFFKSASNLRAERKLALTGTPFVNSPDDIYSLFSFLQLQPFSDQKVFKDYITVKIKRGHEIGMSRLRAALAHVALRRSKNNCELKLVNKTFSEQRVPFPEGTDKDVYDALYSTASDVVRAVLSKGGSELAKRYDCVLELLLRLRQACCSCRLVPQERRDVALEVYEEIKKLKTERALTVNEGIALLEKLLCGSKVDDSINEPQECAVCNADLEASDYIALRTCPHVFCEPCLSPTSNMDQTCPLCCIPYETTDIINKTETVVEHSCLASGEHKVISPKIAALLEHLNKMQPDEKAVVFSQFTSLLDLIEEALLSSGFEYCRIDGTMHSNERINVMDKFATPAGPRLILCSIRAAGTGINLTAANICFLMDVWWNSSAENQAMDRIHRIGQTKDVRVFKLVMKDSIEERMVAIQARKETQAKGIFRKLTAHEKRTASLQDVRFLFNIPDRGSLRSSRRLQESSVIQGPSGLAGDGSAGGPL